MRTDHIFFKTGTTGTGRGSVANVERASKARVEFQVEAVGATPAISWTIQGSHDGTNYVDLEYVTDDSAVAKSKAAQVGVGVGKTQLFVDGLDVRAFEYLAVNVASNTNVTFSARLYIQNLPR